MTIAEMIISELNSLGYLNRGNVSINEIEKIKIKYKDFEDDVRDKSFLAGFSEGYRSNTGVPNEIIKPIISNNTL